MENKTVKIEIRIEEEKKKAFSDYAKDKGTLCTLTILHSLQYFFTEI